MTKYYLRHNFCLYLVLSYLNLKLRVDQIVFTLKGLNYLFGTLLLNIIFVKHLLIFCF